MTKVQDREIIVSLKESREKCRIERVEGGSGKRE